MPRPELLLAQGYGNGTMRNTENYGNQRKEISETRIDQRRTSSKALDLG